GTCPDGEALTADFGCCTPPPPPPPDPTCTGNVVGDGVTCVDPASLKLAASDACAAAGAVLTEYGDDNGGAGRAQSSIAEDVRCAAQPASTCTGNVVGDGMTCVDPASLKQAASDACAAAGLVLTDFFDDNGGVCGAEASIAKYLCCAP